MKSTSTIRRHAKLVRAAIAALPKDDNLRIGDLDKKTEARCLYIAEQVLLWALGKSSEKYLDEWRNPVATAKTQAFHVMREVREEEQRAAYRRSRGLRG